MGISSSIAQAASMVIPVDLKQRVAKAPPHPRLFWLAGGEEIVRAKLKQDARLQAVWESVQITAAHMLNEPPVVYRKDGRRLLGRSREALGRTLHLAFVARMTGDKKYVDRTIAEMKAMAAMPDWNPSHFLDTAEMTLAMAVGYDWLYAKLTPELRLELRTAIEQKGLGPYLKPGTKHGWERGGNNWNQVCHAGMVSGALALLEENSEQAQEVVARALAGLPSAMKVYEPDGTYPEGPGYWNYGTTLNVTLIAMLESALGTDFELSQKPGFSKTGEFPLLMTGPTGSYYNFSDCGNRTSFSPAVVWFANRFHHPEWLWFEDSLLAQKIAGIRKTKGKDQGDRFFPLTLVWADPSMKRTAPTTLNWYGRGHNPLAVFRTSWTDPKAVYLAIKAGTPSASHGHMDVGSFILDADGERWSLDLGMQDYNAMETRKLDIWNNRPGSDRWGIFRYHNRGHSTLLVDDQEQVVHGHAPITEFSGDPGKAFAVVDLSAIYQGQLGGAVRRFTVQPDHRVIIEDQLKGGTKAARVRWGMVTPGTLKNENSHQGWLVKDKQRLKMEVESATTIALQSWSAKPPHEFDEPNPGVSIVGFMIPVPAGQEVKVKVVLTPGSLATGTTN